MELTLDFDEPDEVRMRKGNSEFMENVVKYLTDRFGRDIVLIRRSSSGKGWHVRVMTEVDAEQELAIRNFLNDCRGRCIADQVRLDAGMKTSRLFDMKGEYDSSSGKTKVKKTKSWKRVS